MSAALSLITHLSAGAFVVPLAALMAYVTIFLDYKRVARYLLFLVGVFSAYIAATFLAHPDWGSVLHQTVFPRFQGGTAYWVAAVGLLGTTITPYLFFWQTSGEVEEERGVQTVPRTRADVVVGMVWSNVTAYFMIAATAITLHARGVSINTAADAARALAPVAGPYASLLFAVGIVGAGLLAVPVLATSTAYAVGGTLGWPRGLGRHVRNAPQFYIVLGASLLVGTEMAFIGVDAIKALFYSQVLDGLIGPALLILIWLAARNRAIMGSFVSPRWVDVFGMGAILVMVGADLALLASWLHLI
jgi:Mn2+/Fe2+ NRAMP family transporter